MSIAFSGCLSFRHRWVFQQVQNSGEMQHPLDPTKESPEKPKTKGCWLRPFGPILEMMRALKHTTSVEGDEHVIVVAR